jgi:hypothetical protein
MVAGRNHWGESRMMPEGNNPREQAIRDPLLGLRKQLAEEYRDQPDDRMDEAAKHAVERLGGAKVREFVPILAWRHAREHLRRAS